MVFLSLPALLLLLLHGRAPRKLCLPLLPEPKGPDLSILEAGSSLGRVGSSVPGRVIGCWRRRFRRFTSAKPRANSRTGARTATTTIRATPAGAIRPFRDWKMLGSSLPKRRLAAPEAAGATANTSML
jgi:hypothetical protein